MLTRTLACAVLVCAAATACSSGKPAAKTPATAPSAPSSTAPAAPAAAASTTAAPALNATAVIAKLKTAGLPIGNVTTYTATTDPNHLLGRPGGYTSKASFADTRITADQARDTSSGSVDLGGSVEVFADNAGAAARAAYITKAEASMPIAGTEYDYVSGAVLLRLSQVLTPDQAAAYKKALG